MPGTTPKHGLPFMQGSDIANTIDDTNQAQMLAIENTFASYSAGLLSARPVSTGGSPGIAGRRYRATDTGQLFEDTGTSWIEIAISPVQVAQIADGAVTSRKLKPLMGVAEALAPSQTLTTSEADVTGSVINLSPEVTSKVIVQGSIILSIAQGIETQLWVRQDTTNDGYNHIYKHPPAGGTSWPSIPFMAVFNGVTPGAHTYRLRMLAGTAASASITRFRLIAIAYAE
jgi:hypothetical protein